MHYQAVFSERGLHGELRPADETVLHCWAEKQEIGFQYEPGPLAQAHCMLCWGMQQERCLVAVSQVPWFAGGTVHCWCEREHQQRPPVAAPREKVATGDEEMLQERFVCLSGL